MNGVEVIQGDCLAIMRGMADASVDAVVTDPPAGIGFMGKQWDKCRGGRVQWVAWLAERLAEARRVVRPGHYALVWALPRTSHWTGCAIEDAGWQPIDIISHLFGTGFPKSKSRLKPACEFWWLCRAPGGGKVRKLGIDACRVEIQKGDPEVERGYQTHGSGKVGSGGIYGDYAGVPTVINHSHEASVRHDARGRYPPNLAFTHHPDCAPAGTRRVKTTSHSRGGHHVYPKPSVNCYGDFSQSSTADHVAPDGTEEVAAWLCVDGCPIKALDEMAGERRSAGNYPSSSLEDGRQNCYSEGLGKQGPIYSDSGSASRFFPTFAVEAPDLAPFGYFSKADQADRGPDNDHPTVKSTDLMRWLSRLICPPDGTILDFFMGSGSTGKAAVLEGFGFIGIEENPKDLAIAERRIAEAQLDAERPHRVKLPARSVAAAPLPLFDRLPLQEAP